MRRLLFILVASVAPALFALADTTQPTEDGVIATFDRAFSGGLTNMKLTFDGAAGAEPDGRRFGTLHPTTREAGKAYVRMRLPADVSAVGREKLSATLRALGATTSIEFRWLALDADRNSLFVRRFDLEPGDRWVHLEEPLHGWRWDVRRMGDWDELKEIALVVGTADVDRVDVDDVRFTGTETETQRTDWLLEVAFEDRPHRQADGDGLLVATDAIDALTDDDLNRLLDDMRRARKFVRRVFGDAVRPTDEQHAPISLLIFEDAEQYPAFQRHLGAELRVQITPPRAGGYTIQDIATSTYKADVGPRRPVYLHESVHAIVARDVRLMAGNPQHNALQEAVANYVQICVYPKSIDPAALSNNFGKPIDPDGKSFFKPLEMLFDKPITTNHYAQLASFFAYLQEHDPKLLQALARGLADGKSASDVLAAQGTTWQAVQDAWFGWGKDYFKVGAERGNAVFAAPPEFH